jgi:hypothetical protein
LLFASPASSGHGLTPSLEEVRAFMKAARALFIWKAVSGDSTAMRTGAERIGTGRTGG